MSWSMNRKGTPSEVKENLKTDFENSISVTASYPAEQKQVKQAQEIVNDSLDLLIAANAPAVTVSAYGSCSIDTSGKITRISFSCAVNPYA